MFKGPRQDIYTPAQFAAAYDVPLEKVEEWLRRGFLQADRQRRIAERARLHMERVYGPPGHPRSKLPA